jgi:hypothetical protein
VAVLVHASEHCCVDSEDSVVVLGHLGRKTTVRTYRL